MRPLPFALLGLAALAGCASAPAPGESPTHPAASWWAAPEPTAVLRLSREAQPLRAAPACLGARLREVPDLAHAWWLDADPALRRELGAALAAAGEPGYAASERARAAAPERHEAAEASLRRARELRVGAPEEAHAAAREATAAFEALGDALLAAEARLLAAEAALRGGELDPGPLPVAPTRAQQVQAALLALARERARGAPARLDAALTLADEVGHGAAVAALEALVAAGAVPAPAERAPLHLARFRAAARLGDGERALLEADRALRAAQTSGRAASRDAIEARAALAQARLLLRQPAAAALDAAAAAEAAAAAGLPDIEARAEGLLGAGLMGMSRVEDAALAYGRSEAAAARAGDPAGRARALLNRATALQASGAPRAEVEACLKLVPAAPGPYAREVEARRAIAHTLLELAAGALPAPTAAERLERALETARQGGAYAVVLRFGDLPARLRAPRSGGS